MTKLEDLERLIATQHADLSTHAREAVVELARGFLANNAAVLAVRFSLTEDEDNPGSLTEEPLGVILRHDHGGDDPYYPAKLVDIGWFHDQFCDGAKAYFNQLLVFASVQSEVWRAAFGADVTVTITRDYVGIKPCTPEDLVSLI